jgi:beta-glucanase (GH16 family)
VGLTGAIDAGRRRTVLFVLLAAALLVATIATAAVGADGEDEVATGDDRDRTTTSTSSTSTTLAAPDVVAPDTSATTLVLAPSGTAPRLGAAAPATTTTAAPPPAPPVPAAPAPPIEPCGGSRSKPGGGTWTCTWADEFDGAELDRSRWTVFESSQIGFRAGSSCFVDDPDNVAVAGGALRLTARTEPQWFTCEQSGQLRDFETRTTNGMVSTFEKATWTYGRFEIRAQLPATKVPGIQTALWLWPVNPLRYGPWPMSGEIDIAEFYSEHPDRVIPYVHYAALDGNVTSTSCVIEDVTAWHTYALDWTPELIRISYDDRICYQTAINPAPPLVRPQPFDHPFMLSLTQALGVGTNEFRDGTTPLPATTVVDYVRVWR